MPSTEAGWGGLAVALAPAMGRRPGTAPPRRQRRSASRTLPKQGRPPPAAPGQASPPGQSPCSGEPWRSLGQGHPPVQTGCPWSAAWWFPSPLCLFKPCARRWPSGARSRQDQRQPQPADPLLAKPDRAEVATCEGRKRRRPWRVVSAVRGCPLGTVQDRCEWHGSGTAGGGRRREAWIISDAGSRIGGFESPPGRAILAAMSLLRREMQWSPRNRRALVGALS